MQDILNIIGDQINKQTLMGMTYRKIGEMLYIPCRGDEWWAKKSCLKTKL